MFGFVVVMFHIVSRTMTAASQHIHTGSKQSAEETQTPTTVQCITKLVEETGFGLQNN